MPIEVRDPGEWKKPVPQPSASEAPFWKSAAEGELKLQRCTSCERFQHYPRGLCRSCGGTVEYAPVSGRGEVHTFTIIRQYGAPPFKDELPYVVAMIELEEGVRVMTNLRDCDPEQVHIGMRVEAFALRLESVDGAEGGIAVPYWRPRS